MDQTEILVSPFSKLSIKLETEVCWSSSASKLETGAVDIYQNLFLSWETAHFWDLVKQKSQKRIKRLILL